MTHPSKNRQSAPPTSARLCPIGRPSWTWRRNQLWETFPYPKRAASKQRRFSPLWPELDTRSSGVSETGQSARIHMPSAPRANVPTDKVVRVLDEPGGPVEQRSRLRFFSECGQPCLSLTLFSLALRARKDAYLGGPSARGDPNRPRTIVLHFCTS